ncbi:MAG: hypothetical protein VX642_16345 [Bdellovibrionota bacterium]|nr:hypothetical protein [Bdellovibrionota bacterium]
MSIFLNKIEKRPWGFIIVFILPCIFIFQNCGQGFIAQNSIENTLLVYNEPQLEKVYEGEVATFKIFLNSLEKDNLQFQWFKDGEKLPNSNLDTLSITNSKMSDSGLYHVEIGSTKEGVYKTITQLGPYQLNVFSVPNSPFRPIIISSPPSTSISDGDFKVLRARVDSFPRASIHWFKNSQPILSNDSEYLVIDKIEDFPEGIYHFEASNSVGVTRSPKFYLAHNKMEILPLGAEIFEEKSLRIGQSLHFSPNILSLSSAQITWKKDGVPFSNIEDLALENLTLEDAGTYSISAKNSKGEYQNSFRLNIVKDINILKELPKTINLGIGSELLLEIETEGSIDSYQWFKDGILLSETSEPKLLIDNVQTSDSGIYSVKAINSLEALTSKSNIKIFAVPEIINISSSKFPVKEGEAFSISAEVKGEGLYYKWFRNGLELVGTNSPILSNQSASYADNGNYRLQVSNLSGSKSKAIEIDVQLELAGDILYQRDCARCHGDLNNVAQYSWTIEKVKNAIRSVPAMNGFIDQNNQFLLSDEQLQNITNRVMQPILSLIVEDTLQGDDINVKAQLNRASPVDTKININISGDQIIPYLDFDPQDFEIVIPANSLESSFSIPNTITFPIPEAMSIRVSANFKDQDPNNIITQSISILPRPELEPILKETLSSNTYFETSTGLFQSDNGNPHIPIRKGKFNIYLPPSPPVSSLRDILLFDKQSNQKPTRPQLPPMRFSRDGRIGLNTKLKYSSSGNYLEFYTIKPESLDNHIAKLEPGYKAVSESFAIAYDEIFNDLKILGISNSSPLHFTICDAERDKHLVPYQCLNSKNEKGDCYRLQLFGFSGYADKRLVSSFQKEINIFVENAKTSQAKITSVDYSAPIVRGPDWPVNSVFEPVSTSDGKLLFLRSGSSLGNARHDMVYSSYDINQRDQAPCQLKNFKTLKPLSSAPYDGNVKPFYPFAQLPFRDNKGKVIEDGAYIAGSYPWIDSKGTNIVFFNIHRSNYVWGTNNDLAYDTKCPENVTCDLNDIKNEIVDYTRGLSVVGLWTKGKIVGIDNLINNSDLGFKWSKTGHNHRNLKLYSSGKNQWVRIGNVRDTSSDFGFVYNTSFIDSLENRLNDFEYIKPYTSRDVVWTLLSGKVSADIVFDEFLNNESFIISDMLGAVARVNGNGRWRYQDGRKIEDPSFYDTSEIQLANSATSLEFETPSHGQLVGIGRIEPVALGGIQGKGFYLNENSRIQYTLPDDKNLSTRYSNSHPVYIGIFISQNEINPTEKNIFSFPNKASVSILNGNQVIFRDENQRQINSFTIPSAISPSLAQYFHLAIYRNYRSEWTIAIDGVPLKNLGLMDAIRLEKGFFSIGKNQQNSRLGIKAWIDEFKVIFELPDLERLCNYARGTTVSLDTGAPSDLKLRAQHYPVWYKNSLKNITSRPDQSFTCLTNYDDENGISHRDLPNYATSLRDAILFPEGPIEYNKERPDSSSNNFCLSCHNANNPPSLGLGALVKIPNLNSEDDSRRQPHQAPTLRSGYPSSLQNHSEHLIKYIQDINSNSSQPVFYRQ